MQPTPKVVMTHKLKVFISLEISNVWKKRDSPIDSISSHSWCHNYRKESHITFLLLLHQSHPRAPSQLTRRHRWQRKTVGLVTEHAVGKSHEDYQCLGPGRRKWRFFCSLCWSSPGSPGSAKSIPELASHAQTSKAFTFAMTSHSAKSKHSLRFFHGQILTPNCQGWPLLHPNGKPPFPRK